MLEAATPSSTPYWSSRFPRTSCSPDSRTAAADDTEEVIHNRMQVYRDETEPLLEYYRDELEDRRRRRRRSTKCSPEARAGALGR